MLNATLSESVFNNPTEGNNENLLDISGKEKQKTVIVDGTVGFNSDTVVQYHTVDDIKNYYAKIFEYYLKLNGVKIKGKLDFGEIPESAKHVYTHESKELSEIIQDLNHFSNNFIAGQILYAIGQGEDGYFNLELGLKRLREVLEKFGYKDDEFTLVDGSGLDKNNRLSAEQIVKVLIDAYSDFSVQPDLLASFSRFSKSGTLKKRQLLEPLRH